MFIKIIKVNSQSEIRFGQTTISYARTYSQIIELLRKQRCEQIFLTANKEGFDQIGFTVELKPYLITIPKVYVKNIYNDKIGIRLVFRFLETLVELIKIRALTFDAAMLGSRMVHDENGELKNVSEYLLPKLEKEFLLISGKRDPPEVK